MGRSSDLNLLYGILALQLDFIRREQLIAAMQAWINRKDVPLGEFLVAQGALAAEKHHLMAELVKAHLQQHNDDPRQSLAAISSVDSAYHELTRLPDADIQASIGHLPQPRLAGQSGGDPNYDPNTTLAISLGQPTSDGVRFRILRPHARGGLGEVFVARDGELNREVALKQIQPHHADDADSRSRFTLEAEITGGLEHPGIVPVYGLGTYDDGRPFYAMRFIRGDSLKGAIERFHAVDKKLGRDPSERALEFRKLLGRFVDVCQAIGYAHSRGVLHRDLKPGNIMLGKYGETLVVDWGLAKVIGRKESTRTDEQTLKPHSGSSVAATQNGSAIGTPAFMSPEQAAGRLDELGPATDIYSLGATLYVLLTGVPPTVGSNFAEVLDRVRSGQFPKPSEIYPSVAKPLEAICLKAMSLRAEDRYRSAEELAEDVEHWLADEPVDAYVEPLRQRLGRSLRKRPALVGAISAAILVGLVATSLGAIVLRRQNLNLQQARDTAILNQQAAIEQRKQTELQRLRATKLANDYQYELERSHFYLERFLNLKRFGRDVSKTPLIHACDVNAKLSQHRTSVISRSQIYAGQFDDTRPFQLNVRAQCECFGYVFQAHPRTKAEAGQNAGTGVSLVTNRTGEPHFELAPGQPVTVNELYPVKAEDEPSYLYLIATAKPWLTQERVDRIRRQSGAEFPSRSGIPERDRVVQVRLDEQSLESIRRDIAGMVEAGSGDLPQIVAEEILLFEYER